MKNMESLLESLVFRSRWLLAPFFFGLIISIAVLLLHFCQELWVILSGAAHYTEHHLVIAILTLVDLAMVASLLLIIAFSGYENFVSKIGVGKHEDRPAWMGKVSFSDLKVKLMGAIVAISAIELLKAFIDMDQYTERQLIWKVGIHLTFVVSGVLFAATDRIVEGKGNQSH